MAKRKVTAIVKIQLPAGAATPAPPVGTALGPHGVKTMDFVQQYNAATEARRGQVAPVEITTDSAEFVSPAESLSVKGRLDKSMFATSSVMTRVPKLTACWRISSINSGPLMPWLGWEALGSCTHQGWRSGLSALARNSRDWLHWSSAR